MTEKELEQLYNEAYKAVYWTAISILKNKEDAEDVVQDTFITAYESYDTLQDKTKAVPWIKKIAANKCINIVTREEPLMPMMRSSKTLRKSRIISCLIRLPSRRRAER